MKKEAMGSQEIKEECRECFWGRKEWQKNYVQIIISRRNSSDYLPIVHMCSLYGFYSQKFSLEMFYTNECLKKKM